MSGPLGARIRGRWSVAAAVALAFACTDARIVPLDGGGGQGGDVVGGGGGGRDAAVDAPALGGNGGGAGAGGAGGTAGSPVGGQGGFDAAVDVGGGGSGGAEADAGRDATPDAPPPTVRPSRGGEAVITEIMIDTDVVGDDFGEWFEVWNPSQTQWLDLDGCIVSDEGNNHVIAERLVLAPGAFVTLAKFPKNEPAGFVPDYSYGTLKFSNDGDSVRLVCGGTIIDAVDYTADAVRSGRSLNLDPGKLDAAANDQMANWCRATTPYATRQTISDYGTPGAPNVRCAF